MLSYLSSIQPCRISHRCGKFCLASQSEERAVAEAAMLARQLDGAHGELRKAKQVQLAFFVHRARPHRRTNRVSMLKTW